MRNKKNLRFPECSPSGLDLCAPAPLLRLDSSPFTIRDLPPAHNPDEQFLHIGTTFFCFWSEKKQIVTLEDQIFPSPPAHNPDEQFLHIGTKLKISKGTILPVEKSRWRCFTHTITSVDKDQISHFFVKMMIWFLSAVKSILTIFKEMFHGTSSNYSHMTTAALPVFRSNIFFLE